MKTGINFFFFFFQQEIETPFKFPKTDTNEKKKKKKHPALIPLAKFNRKDDTGNRCGRKWCVTVIFPPGNSTGCGNLEPQSTSGSPPADDFIDTHSFLHRAENWEKLEKDLQ